MHRNLMTVAREHYPLQNESVAEISLPIYSPAMKWRTMRAHYERLYLAAKASGETQESVAERGALSAQNMISKMLANDNLGPQVETFVKAIEGLGMSVSAFFLQLEEKAADTLTILDGQKRHLQNSANAATISTTMKQGLRGGDYNVDPVSRDALAALSDDLAATAGKLAHFLTEADTAHAQRQDRDPRREKSKARGRRTRAR